jgi:phosphate uptake regulator
MADTNRHILGSYDAALSALQNDLLMMASLCERNLRNSLGCLLNRDEDLCNVTIADDEASICSGVSSRWRRICGTWWRR